MHSTLEGMKGKRTDHKPTELTKLTKKRNLLLTIKEKETNYVSIICVYNNLRKRLYYIH